MQRFNFFLSRLCAPFQSFLALFCLFVGVAPASAYPIFAQKAYSTPREETGRIVCANCHLASKPVALEMPQAILPSQVFSVRAEIPTAPTAQQVLGTGQKGPLNLRAVVIVPPNFRLAAPNELSPEQKSAAKGVLFQPYSEEHPNMFVAGPLPANRKTTLTVNLVAPQSMPFRSYPVYVGGNRGRGQIYPDGQKSNNTVFTSPVKRRVDDIVTDAKGDLIVLNADRRNIEVEIPKGPDILVQKNQQVDVDQPLTNNPNVGGFGQVQGEFVFQSPIRLISLQMFLWSICLAQIALVLKKKQIEVVQQQEV